MEKEKIQQILEAALLAYSKPLSVETLQSLFAGDLIDQETEELPDLEVIKTALFDIQKSCDERGFELKEVSSGWRFQVRADMAQWVNKLWEEKPQKYSRALLETLAIIAYRQPITRGDIEEVRGVAVSSQIIKTLTEREWIKVVGQRDVPGRPSLFATTKQFLDYFNMKSLEELPSLQELADLDSLAPELDLLGQGSANTSDTVNTGNIESNIQPSNDPEPSTNTAEPQEVNSENAEYQEIESLGDFNGQDTHGATH